MISIHLIIISVNKFTVLLRIIFIIWYQFEKSGDFFQKEIAIQRCYKIAIHTVWIYYKVQMKYYEKCVFEND